jgi:hypothetical protein
MIASDSSMAALYGLEDAMRYTEVGIFLPPPSGGSTPEGGWGCLLQHARLWIETPPPPFGHLPRKTGEESTPC